MAPMKPMKRDSKRSDHDGASPGKIFVGGLPKDTSMAAFMKHFEKYGEIIDSVIMKDRHTQQPRGFGFITYSDPSVVDKVIEETHVFNGKTVEIKRTIPKGAAQTKDFKTKKIFVGGIPTTVTEDELKAFFSKYGKVAEHEIIRDHATKRSRGFGFVIFESEHVVDELLSNGNMIDLAGSQVEIKKAEPKKASNPPAPAFVSEPRRPFGDGYTGFGGPYSAYPEVGYVHPSYRTPGGLRPELGLYDRYGPGASDYGSRYRGYGLGSYPGEPPIDYSSRLGVGSYGDRDEGFAGRYGGPSNSYGGGYDSGPGTGYGSSGPYGRAGNYGGGADRYHPYAR